jgi:hypothetical protein
LQLPDWYGLQQVCPAQALTIEAEEQEIAVVELLGILPDILRYDNHPSLFLKVGTFFQFE